MKCFVRTAAASGDASELVLERPLAQTLTCIAEHLGGRTRGTFERIARVDRERTPGEHAFDRLELLELCAAAHALLVEPPPSVRRQRRIATGALPGVDAIHGLVTWLAARGEVTVVYDLWRSATADGD